MVPDSPSQNIKRYQAPCTIIFYFAHASCTDCETFNKKQEELKSTSKNKSSSLEVYINDSFYEKAYQWLKPKPQGQESSILINQTNKRWIIGKQWRVTTDIDVGKILHKQMCDMWFWRKNYSQSSPLRILPSCIKDNRDKMED